jgi:hypothetical protein
VSALKKRGVKVTVVEANPASARALERAGVARADSVVLCGLHRLEPKQADAQVGGGVQGWMWGGHQVGVQCMGTLCDGMGTVHHPLLG